MSSEPVGVEKKLIRLQQEEKILERKRIINTPIDNGYIEDNLPSEDEYAEEPHISDEADVNKTLGYIAYWERKREGVRRTTEAEQKRLGSWMARSINKIDQKIAFHSAALQGYLTRTKQRKVDVPNGKIYKRKQPTEYIFPNGKENPTEYMDFCNRNKDEPFIITERRVDRNEVKKYIKSTGHIPDGVDVEFHDREKFHYKLDN